MRESETFSGVQWKWLLQTALKNRVPVRSRPHYDCRMEPAGIQMHLRFQRFLVPLRLDRDPNRYSSTRLIWHFRSSLFIGPGVHTQIIAFWIGSYGERVCAATEALCWSSDSFFLVLIGHHKALENIQKKHNVLYFMTGDKCWLRGWWNVWLVPNRSVMGSHTCSSETSLKWILNAALFLMLHCDAMRGDLHEGLGEESDYLVLSIKHTCTYRHCHKWVTLNAAVS